MVRSCTLLQIVRKPTIIGFSLFDLALILGISLFVGDAIYKKSELYLKRKITYRDFIYCFIVLVILIYLLINYLFKYPTMIGYYLKINPLPLHTNCSF